MYQMKAGARFYAQSIASTVDVPARHSAKAEKTSSSQHSFDNPSVLFSKCLQHPSLLYPAYHSKGLHDMKSRGTELSLLRRYMHHDWNGQMGRVGRRYSSARICRSTHASCHNQLRPHRGLG